MTSKSNILKKVSIGLAAFAMAMSWVVGITPTASAATDCSTLTESSFSGTTLEEKRKTTEAKDCPCEYASLTGDYTMAGGMGCSDTGNVKCLFGTYVNADGDTKNCIFTTIIDTVLFLIGAICVVMIIYGGVRYTISGGESGAVTNAKNTILYAVVGLIIAVLAYAIVNFVIGRLTQ